MKNITDEILNDYIDNQLDGATIQELKKQLDENENALNRLKALRVVDNSLKNIDIIPAPEGFTNRLMDLIAKSTKKVVSKVSYFFVSVIGLFTIMIISVLGFAYYTSAKSNQVSGYDTSLLKVSEYVNRFISLIKNFFSNQNITTVGMALTVLLLISGYYLLESHKEFKEKIKNLS